MIWDMKPTFYSKFDGFSSLRGCHDPPGPQDIRNPYLLGTEDLLVLDKLEGVIVGDVWAFFGWGKKQMVQDGPQKTSYK